ncbi:MAG TPA: winged helix-turn-helix domain-containing protein [Ktedonobacteraceae bacterium]|nr:winged helix-turn-helix domain-containing protein [Ktedonobacteraceae bacterium]
MAIPPESESEAVLPEEVPVVMPDLPPHLKVNTAQQFKAMGDPLRWRILNLIQYQPYTAKQIAERLKASPGTIGHHLQVLEASGLAQVVARRIVHGIVAKYYTRTARIFKFDFPSQITGNTSTALKFMTDAHDEMAEAIEAEGEGAVLCSGLPRVRFSRERAEIFMGRLNALIDELLEEKPDPAGQVYTFCTAFFKAPPYLQTSEQKDQ